MQYSRVLTTLLVVFLSACATVSTPVTIPQNGSPAGEISVGDRVEIVTDDGFRYEFKVRNVDATGLSGDSTFIDYQDMVSLSVLNQASSSSSNNWIWWVVGALAVGALLASQPDNDSKKNLYEGWADNWFVCGFLYKCDG